MSLAKHFFRIYRFFTFKGIRNSAKRNPDIQKWEKILNSIPHPNDDIERSFARFTCRMHYHSLFYKFIANSVALIGLLSFFKLRGGKDNKHTRSEKKEKKGCVLVKITKITQFEVGYADILPPELEKSYGTLQLVIKPEGIKRYLTPYARTLLIDSISRRPFRFLFNYWIFRELCFYSYILDEYNPNAIAVYVNERNIAAPMISSLCEERGTDFVSFMHGDYIMQLLHGFMRFTKYYAWDEHYVKMFIEDLRCEPGQFRIYKPDKYKGICKPRESGIYEYFATYYTGNESREILSKIAQGLEKLKKKGFICKLRPHPRAINLKIVKEVFKDFIIEDPSAIKLSDSMENSKYIIALNSTVLSEAYYSGKEIVIDDFSDPEAYLSLKDRKYINIFKPHTLLSDLISENP
jgi:hypothetical protein